MENDRQLPRIIENPFIKSQNREWSISLPTSLNAPVSPPRTKKTVNKETREDSSTAATTTKEVPDDENGTVSGTTDLAAIEAGQISIENHLEVLSASLFNVTRPPMVDVPRLARDEWINLYKRNKHPKGRHFVIHQHDHPVAGPHYDLRLQFSETSSVSFAIMYGLPGSPNSRRLNRNATETRVHTLWSHLIESASSTTGSLLIWDTGEYSILPYYEDKGSVDTDHSQSSLSESSKSAANTLSESEKLRMAFQERKIRLKLHGTRLPPDYTVTLRLTRSNDMSQQPRKPARKRRRKASGTNAKRTPSPSTSSDGESAANAPGEKLQPSSDTTSPRQDTPAAGMGTHSDAEGDETIRLNNAYPGATNSISSVHQRRWFLTLDRVNSGFEKQQYRDGSSRRQHWARKHIEDPDGNDKLLGFEAFYIRGPDTERSVVTGRLSRGVMQDEGVNGFVGRKGWRPVFE